MVLRGSYRTETFEHNGQQWTRYLCAFKPETIFVMGVDLAMTMDFTAVAILRHSRAPPSAIPSSRSRPRSPKTARPC